jgi:LmeA-like phospholipid-binding
MGRGVMSVTSKETGVAEPITHRRPRRTRGLLLPVVGIILVVAAIAVVADRVAAKAASDQLKSRIAAELVSRQVSYSSLDVTVGGTPFLTQVAEGHYDSITINLIEVRLPAGGDREASLPALHVVATGVNADTGDLIQGTATVVADQVTGTAVVAYDTLRGLIDLSDYGLSDVTFTETDGTLKANASANLAGLNLPIEAVAAVSVADGQIRVQLQDARAVGVNVPQVAKSFIDNLVNNTLVAKLPALPFGLTLDRLLVAPDGLAITATGFDVPIVNGRVGD